MARFEDVEARFLEESPERSRLEAEVVVLGCQQVPATPREPGAQRADVAGRERDNAAGAQMLMGLCEVAPRLDGVLDVIPRGDCVEQGLRFLDMREARAGDNIGLSRERVRQLDTRALGELERRAPHLRHYLEDL